MNEVRILLNEEEDRLLASMIGEKWISRGSGQCTRDGSMSTFSYFAKSTRGPITFLAKFIEIPIGDESIDLAELSITDGHEEEEFARRQGFISLEFGGQTIESISIVRDTVERFRGDFLDWRLIADRGFLFRLENGQVAICNGGDLTVDFFVTTAEDPQELEIPDYRDLWESNLEERFETSRSIIPVQDLVPDSR